MNTVLKIGALLVGAYLVFQHFLKDQETTAPTTTTPGAPNVSELVSQLALAANPAVRPLLLNADQWNYYYQQLRGTAGLPFETLFPGQPDEQRQRRLTVEEWWAASSAHGLSGLHAGGYRC